MTRTDEDYIPPMPRTQPEGASIWEQIRLARQDLFTSQPERFYRAWMAQRRAVLFDVFTVNQPSLVHLILDERPQDFPKSGILGDTLKLLLGNSVFVSNGETWKRQRRIIDPAFEGGRLREVFPAMVEAGEAAVARLADGAGGPPIELQFETAYAAADVIFRTLFSIPITDDKARTVYEGFAEYQAAQPLMTVPALMRLPRWVPRFRSRQSRRSAGAIRRVLLEIIEARKAEIAAGTAPQDLATKIMTTADPETGRTFDAHEMADQVATFFLAGHETSASSLAWTLYLLAAQPKVQERVAEEAAAAWDAAEGPAFSDMRKLAFTRDVFREALRLYPPVSMVMRDVTRPETFRNREVKPGSVCVLSPWHLQRHERIWDRPHVFDPDRWSTRETRETARQAYIPFSSGPRACTGAGFAMVEGVLLLALLTRAFRFEPDETRPPHPVLRLTVRSETGIWLKLTPRG